MELPPRVLKKFWSWSVNLSGTYIEQYSIPLTINTHVLINRVTHLLCT